MHGLGVGTRPLGGVLNIVVVTESVRCLYMERRTLGMLPGFFVVAIMREVVIEETAIIGEEITNAFLLFCGCLLDGDDRACLHRLAPLFPFLNRFLAIFCRVSSHKRELSDLAPEELKDILVLILVDHLAELGGYGGVGLGLVFEPTAKCHEALDEVNDGGLLVEL